MRDLIRDGVPYEVESVKAVREGIRVKGRRVVVKKGFKSDIEDFEFVIPLKYWKSQGLEHRDYQPYEKVEIPISEYDKEKMIVSISWLIGTRFWPEPLKAA